MTIDAVHWEVTILEARLARVRTDLGFLLKAIRSCQDELRVLQTPVTQEAGMAAAPAVVDPFQTAWEFDDESGPSRPE